MSAEERPEAEREDIKSPVIDELRRSFVVSREILQESNLSGEIVENNPHPQLRITGNTPVDGASTFSCLLEIDEAHANRLRGKGKFDLNLATFDLLGIDPQAVAFIDRKTDALDQLHIRFNVEGAPRIHNYLQSNGPKKHRLVQIKEEGFDPNLDTTLSFPEERRYQPVSGFMEIRVESPDDKDVINGTKVSQNSDGTWDVQTYKWKNNRKFDIDEEENVSKPPSIIVRKGAHHVVSFSGTVGVTEEIARTKAEKAAIRHTNRRNKPVISENVGGKTIGESGPFGVGL